MEVTRNGRSARVAASSQIAACGKFIAANAEAIAADMDRLPVDEDGLSFIVRLDPAGMPTVELRKRYLVLDGR